MKDHISLKFFLNEAKAKGDLGKIYLRIYVNRIKAELATQFKLAPSEWDETRQRAKKSNLINQELSKIEHRIFTLQSILEYENRPITARILKDLYLEKDKINAYLLEFYDKFLEGIENNPELSKETFNLYKQTHKYINSFVKEQYKIKDIPIKQVDFKFINSLDSYLLNNNLQRNTVNKHHSRFRTLIHRAIKEGQITKNPYEDLPLKKVKVNREALTKSELHTLTTHDLGGNESLQRVRDIFVFSVYTGLRFQDAQDLKISEIVKFDSDQPFIKTIQIKTGEQVTIPLLKPALEIVKRYDLPEREITGKILPKITNQKLNAYLKVIAELVGIKKNLTHHVARHTCATTVLLSNDIPMKVVSNWLGHTNIRQTEQYAKITPEYLEKVAKDVEEKI